MAAYKEKAEVVITPATWKQRVDTLEKTPTNLRNLVGWFGSTHALAMWRKAYEFLDVFRGMDVTGFDPQIDGWEEFYIAIEAEAMATASVIIIRLENNELLNGSLGSIAEIGMALTSAALRGQVVIVSIEENLLNTLNGPGAIAQYLMAEMSLETLERTPNLAQYLRIHRGDDLQELAILACTTAQKQMETPQMGVNYDEFLARKRRRRQNYPFRVLLGGSGGPYSEEYEEVFRNKKQVLLTGFRPEDQIKILSEGAIAEAWKIPYSSIDNVGVTLTTRTIETEFKHEADVLMLPIIAEGASKAAATEIGWLLLNSLNTGQSIRIIMESFDPVDYMRHKLQTVNIDNCADEKCMRVALRQAGVSAVILATAVQREIFETFEIFTELMHSDNHNPTIKQLKKSLLGRTDVFQQADNIRRVRALVQAHLEELVSDERFPHFFSYSNQILS